ncbi:hypothetical protein TNIN_277661 [Trichonephila inaurata madagascariensis]|uniref:Uncharacterized protein n=1 Tax=Trichonephila inaurata madagascariensis TaxID=2747483 RepID=A0A8X7C573_9ARAC|nr:hypothetical protein TNIN_97851 [Trichonephila inaurata madagascariensis]GFY59091.1 hypothetical protein TNIN_277661 [Trichonephila inaurata madagascariensis]
MSNLNVPRLDSFTNRTILPSLPMSLPDILSHYPELTLTYHDTTVCDWSYTQTFWTMKRRHPHHWKLDSYLQMKPLRHYSRLDKKIFISLNELLGEEDWVQELLKNGSGEPFEEEQACHGSPAPRKE